MTESRAEPKCMLIGRKHDKKLVCKAAEGTHESNDNDDDAADDDDGEEEEEEEEEEDNTLR